MSPFKNKFLRNVATLQFGGAMSAGLAFVSSVGLAHVLGARDQGLWVVSLQLYAFAFFLINLGMVQVAITQVAAASARGLKDKVADWLAFVAKAYLLFGVFLVVSGWFVLPHVVDLWHAYNPTVDVRVARWAWMLSFAPLLDVPRAVAVTALQGTRRMVALTQLENATELTRTFLVIAGAVITRSPFGAVLGQLMATFVGSVLGVALYRRSHGDGSYPLPGVRAIAHNVRHVPFRMGLRLALRFGIMRQLDALGSKIAPPLIIQTFGTPEWVAYFRIAQGIMNVPLMLMQGISRTALPAMAELKGLKMDARFERVYWRATLFGGGLITAGLLLCLPVVRVLVWKMFPSDYHEPIWELSLILALALTLVAFSIAFDSFYLGTNALRAGIAINLLSFFVSVPLMAYLAHRIPTTGAAWGYVGIGCWMFVHNAYILWHFRHARRGAT